MYTKQTNPITETNKQTKNLKIVEEIKKKEVSRSLKGTISLKLRSKLRSIKRIWVLNQKSSLSFI